MIGTLLPYPNMGATLGIEIFIIFLLVFFEGVRIFLGMYTAHLAPVHKMNNTHFKVTVQWITLLISVILIRWIMIYLVDDIIQCLNNWGLKII